MIKMKLSGDMKRLQRDISSTKVQSVLGQVDAEIGIITKMTVAKQARLAPVDTGLLRNTIAGSDRHAGFLHWQILSNLDVVPYYWRQNFEHRTKRYYITKPANEAGELMQARLQRVVDRAW